MSATPHDTLDLASRAIWRDFERTMAAKQTRPQTLVTYGYAVIGLYIAAGKIPLEEITREHVETYLAGLGELGRSTATIDTYYRALRRFYNWAESAELIDRTPIRGIERPQVASKLADVLSAADISALVKACKGKDARSRRDEAMIRILAESGPRASELCGLQTGDVDIFSDHLLIREGKWARERLVPFGNKTGSAISAYLRVRPKGTGSDAVWLAERAPHAPMTRSGVAQMLEYRCERAGLPKIHPHQLRHTAVSRFFEAGGSERDAMKIFGWVKDDMCKLYGGQAAGRVALGHFRALALGDDF
jgi:site-specific recombinase XerD